MLHDFAIAISSIVIAVSGALGNGAQQLSTAIGNFLHPDAATSITYVQNDSADAQPKAPAATTNDPFHTSTSSLQGVVVDEATSSQPVTPLSKSQPAGNVLGASTATQAIIERIVEGGITQDQLTAALNALSDQFNRQLSSLPSPAISFSGPAATTPVSTATFAPSQRIDQLRNVTITNATVNGVSGLTDTDIPDSLTASNYLPLSGGTLTGDLTMSGTLTAGTLSVAGISSAGALIGPYVTATSTTATSTFAGGFSAASSLYALQNGNVGIGTTSPQTLLHVAVASDDAAVTFTNANTQYGGYAGLSGKGAVLRVNNIVAGTQVSDSLTILGGYRPNENEGGWIRFGGKPNGTSGGSVQVGIPAPSPFSSLTTPGAFQVYAADSNSYPILFSITPGSTEGAAFSKVYIASKLGIGTTTPQWLLNPFSSTAPQLALSAGGGIAQWAFRNAGGNLHFATTTLAGTATTSTSALTINGSSGNVGIGTAAPTGKLQVYDAAPEVRITSSNTTGQPALYIARDGDTIGAKLWLDNANGVVFLDSLFNSDFGTIRVRTKAAGTPVNALTIRGSGHVGILNTAPTFDFDVTGAGRFTSLVDASHFVATSTTATSTFAGAVGIGNNTTQVTPLTFPAGLLHVSSGMNQNNTYFDQNTNDALGPNVLLRKIGSDTTGFRVLTNGDALGTLTFSGRFTSSYSVIAGATIKAVLSASPSGASNSMPTDLVFSTHDATVNPVEGMRLDRNGNLGIGSTTPYAKLSVTNTGSGPSFIVEDATSPDSTPFIVDASGNVGIGTTSPISALQVYNTSAAQATFNGWDNVGGTRPHNGSINIGDYAPYQGIIHFNDAQNTNFYLDSTYDNAGSAMQFRMRTAGTAVNAMTILGSGNVGIATTTPWRTLSVTGTVGFDGLTGATGAGSLCLDSNKQVVYNSASDNCLSSTRATKHDINPLVLDALSQVLALQPVSFIYNEGDGRTRYGFIAEDTAAVDTHLVTYDASSTVSGIDDRSIIAMMVSAIKDLYAKVQEYFARTERLEERVSALEAQLAAAAAGTTDTHTEAATGSVPGSANDAEDAQGIIAPQDDSATTTSATTIPPNDNDPVSSNVQEPLPPAAANDNQPVADDENEPEAQEATPEPAVEEPAAILEDPAAPELEPPNDNAASPSAAAI